jgi:hypothetical protein
MTDLENKLEDHLKDVISQNQKHFQFSARFWRIQQVETFNEIPVSFPKYNSRQFKIMPFYKPISKIVNISALSKNE